MVSLLEGVEYGELCGAVCRAVEGALPRQGRTHVASSVHCVVSG